jgi:alpha-tubulin suppressor-like RCC1 family protein
LALAAGDEHTCALQTSGSVECWGDVGLNLTSGPVSPQSSTPVAIAGLTGVTALSSYAEHTCALLADGTVRCWGDNSAGQLGDWGTERSSATPVDVFGLAGATAIAAGSGRTCALLAGGTVACWGGTTASGNGAITPIAVMGL